MMLVNSQMLEKSATVLRKTHEPQEIPGEPGVTVSAAQCDTAARILREAEPSQITKATGVQSGSVNFDPQERPGFIDAARQDDPLVLTFTVGIITSTTYRIDRKGNVLPPADPLAKPLDQADDHTNLDLLADALSTPGQQENQ